MSKCQHLFLEKYKTMKELRKSKGFTQKQLAQIVGIPRRGTISDWETGKSFPTDDHIERLARAFNMSFHELKSSFRYNRAINDLKELKIDVEAVLNDLCC